jgi:hypothetical protein
MLKFLQSSFDDCLFQVMKNWKKSWRIRKTWKCFYKYNNTNLEKAKFYKNKKTLMSSYWYNIIN